MEGKGKRSSLSAPPTVAVTGALLQTSGHASGGGGATTPMSVMSPPPQEEVTVGVMVVGTDPDPSDYSGAGRDSKLFMDPLRPSVSAPSGGGGGALEAVAEPLKPLTKGEEFKKHLTQSGFKWAIVRAFVTLYEEPEKPDDPLEWILGFIGGGIPSRKTIEEHYELVNALRQKVEDLQLINLALKKEIEERLEAAKPDALAVILTEWTQYIHALTHD